MNPQQEELNKIAKFFNSKNIVSSEDMQSVLEGVMHVLANHRKSTDEMNEGARHTILALLDQVVEKHDEHKSNIDKGVMTQLNSHNFEIKNLIGQIQDSLEMVKTKIPKDGKPGKSVDPEEVAAIVVSKLKNKKGEKLVKMSPIELAEGLETLTDEDRLSADAIEEKSLLSLLEKFFKGNKFVKYAVSGSRFLSTLMDVSITAPIANQTLIWDAVNHIWINGTAGGGGGFANQQVIAGTTSNTYTNVLTTAPTGILLLFANGQLQTTGTDYTVSGKTITTTPSGGGNWNGATLVAVY